MASISPDQLECLAWYETERSELEFILRMPVAKFTKKSWWKFRRHRWELCIDRNGQIKGYRVHYVKNWDGAERKRKVPLPRKFEMALYLAYRKQLAKRPSKRNRTF